MDVGETSIQESQGRSLLTVRGKRGNGGAWDSRHHLPKRRLQASEIKTAFRNSKLALNHKRRWIPPIVSSKSQIKRRPSPTQQSFSLENIPVHGIRNYLPLTFILWYWWISNLYRNIYTGLSIPCGTWYKKTSNCFKQFLAEFVLLSKVAESQGQIHPLDVKDGDLFVMSLCSLIDFSPSIQHRCRLKRKRHEVLHELFPECGNS